MEVQGCRRRQLPVLLLWVGSKERTFLAFPIKFQDFLASSDYVVSWPCTVDLKRGLLEKALKVNGLMTLGFTGAHQRTDFCNESLMIEKLPACGKSFEEMMKRVDSKNWCNLTEFIMYYDNFTQCTEHEANNASCFWPNPLAEGFITGIHKQFFSNCTSENVHWEDPPGEILIILILIPVMLTCAMITVVVWCSKRSDILV